ncbi:hemolysin family protein [Nocardioides marmoribigeumensis]|uniref:CBS domain containing-hemolysin-like protein n=1 Tax=Nocardioides marmoribigeumensis TaxID=433649 RepID=A0ABU2BWI6_9ACTN|nr:hemolysin family protein [Nocardioides marmoribigeumensis]MDR7362188.1 CBS domain containing-hemolysin-like protein [Nocardioides marmoribigeumensis]
MGDGAALLLAVVLLALNAFFVGAEFALISARRTRIEPLVAGSRAARTTLRAMERVSLVMAGAQLGITACSLGLGAVGEPAVAHLLEPVFARLGLPEAVLHPVAFVLALAVVVALHVVLGEMVPKNIALAGPERAALLLGPPMMLVVTLLRPVVVVLNATANGILRLLRVEPRDEIASSYTRTEVSAMLDESRHEGALGDDEYDRLAGALGFTERTVETVLLPLDDLVTLPQDAPLADIETACAETGFSRFPVRAPDGALVGYVHVKDVLETDPGEDDRLEDKRIRSFATIRPSQRLHEAFSTLRRRGAHLGRVVDDEGELLGLVALEDVLEELVGEIRDSVHS